jgi:hypothetical protein
MFASYLGNLFFDAEAGPEAAPQVPITEFEDFTATELGDTLVRHFRGSASSGMCPVPSQVVKHLTGEALAPLATFLN